MSVPPMVSCVLITYQFEHLVERSIKSVLAQDYPPERLEIIVIDDGSTDGTPEVIEPYLDRVRYIRQENKGELAATSRGLAEASGDFLAIASGDDMWTPDKLALQMEVFERRPEVGMVYGDMTVVDADDRVIAPSFWSMEGIVPHRGRPLSALVRANFVTTATIVVRKELRSQFNPLPPWAGWVDWWIALSVAQVADIDYVKAPVQFYRQHATNQVLGTGADRALDIAAGEAPLRRWMLTGLDHSTIDPASLATATRLYEHCLAQAARVKGVPLERAAGVTVEDAIRAGEAVKAGDIALARGELAQAMSNAARAVGHHATDPPARALFEGVCAALNANPAKLAAAPSTIALPKRARRATDSGSPRVTVGIATFNRDTYLAEAVQSVLSENYEDFELLVVADGSTNPAIDEVLASFEDPRLRVVRHPENKGIAEAYNTMVREGRGELVAMLGDDDICMPGRLAREVAIFDAHPDTGVVHGDALVIDAQGIVTGRWESREFSPAALIQTFFRSHNHLVDPTRMVHRRVYEAVGGYDSRYPIAQDFHFWLRAARDFRFRHCPDGPLVGFRRHGENTSDESSRQLEVNDVERALEEAMELYSLRQLVPELDWAVLDPNNAERQALLALADTFERRALPLPKLAARMRTRAQGLPAFQKARPVGSAALGGNGSERGRRLMMTAFGWNDPGGGTTVPRLAAKELTRRGWDVTVFHAATKPTDSGLPYEVVESEEDGVRLLAVHNRAHGIWDLGNPLRELDDPPITAAFAAALDRLRPEIVHFHNLHNLGAALIDQTAARGIPSYFSTHNYWLMCPRAYLMTGTGEICAGPGDGAKCASCVQSPEAEAHRLRLHGIRARVSRGVTACLTVSEAVRRTLLGAGYPAEMLDVVRQSMPHDKEIWERLGRDRKPGRRGERLTVGFLGSAYPHKGPQLLAAAAQRTRAEVKVEIHGEVPAAFAKQLTDADHRGVVELCSPFQPSEIDRVLAGVDVAALPSIWWDCAPLAAAECLAARVPVLAPRLGGLAEAVKDGVNGLLFNALDIDDLARCLDRLHEENGLLEHLQSSIEAPNSFSAYIDELEAYYSGERPGRVGARQEHKSIEGGRSAAPRPPGRGVNLSLPHTPVVRWQGDHGLCTSLSIVNARLTERLAPVQRVSREGTPLDPPGPHAADVEVRHQWPPDLSPPASGRLAVIQPWEFGAIPREWVTSLEENVEELWVPSEFVRRMYLDAGLNPERVVSLPNGVNLDRFSPHGEPSTLPELADVPAGATRFLFVGGLIWRKGPDVLLAAWKAAFADRDDVVLIVKDVGVGGVYREGDREQIAEHVASGVLPRVVLVSDELDEEAMAGLYRSADVLVHPYRGEGFAMPVLEAMACGTPAIVTAGGPTDEFCPPEAGWRIRASRFEFAADRVGNFETVGPPWVLEPDVNHLAELLALAQSSPAEVSRRGVAARAAAERYGWDEIAGAYRARIVALGGDSRACARSKANSARARESPVFEDNVALRLLATPAWRGEDRLDELLRVWSATTTQATSACLYLLADTRVDGSQEELHARVLAAGVDLEGAADINVWMEPIDGDADLRLHGGVDAFVALHDACEGHIRMARAAGNRIVTLDGDDLERFLSEASQILAPA